MDKKPWKVYRERLAELFSGYRAEWLDEKVFELFTEPSYFPQLTGTHPCFLEGGRGTGKTTALRCLSYQGQAALRRIRENSDLWNWPYVGLYYRVNTNRVRAFSGPELNATAWVRLFAHYINLEFCEAVAGFLLWYAQANPRSQKPTPAALGRVATSLHVRAPANVNELMEELVGAKLRFEAAINNIGEGTELPLLSLQGAPIDALMGAVRELPQFRESAFFFLVDEYENLVCTVRNT